MLRFHPFAHERLGVLACRTARGAHDTIIFLPTKYFSLPDELYEDDKNDPSVLIGSKAITRVMSFAYETGLSCLYVHIHGHDGVPGLSSPDMKHGNNLVRSLKNVNSKVPQGFIVLSNNASKGLLSIGGAEPRLCDFTTSIISAKTDIR